MIEDGAAPPPTIACPRCGNPLTPGERSVESAYRMHCARCGATFRARRKGQAPPSPAPRPIGRVSLTARAAVLWALPAVYRLGLGVGWVSLFALGGFARVGRGWLDNRVGSLGDAVRSLGGLPIVVPTADPDQDYGVKLRRVDAPRLFDELIRLGRDLDVKPPDEVRLAFLPCCGVVAWRRSRMLLVGLPLLPVLTQAELRSILAHELTHLAKRDATWTARALSFVDSLGRALDDPSNPRRGPLRSWAVLCRRFAVSLVGPIAWGQEARADRAAAQAAGGLEAASALVKVAMVQPIFREVLQYHDPEREDQLNLYAFFRSFWDSLPPPLVDRMRLDLLASASPSGPTAHPPLPDRVAHLQAYPDRRPSAADRAPSLAYLGDLESIEQMMNDQLYRRSTVEPTIFHLSGS